MLHTTTLDNITDLMKLRPNFCPKVDKEVKIIVKLIKTLPDSVKYVMHNANTLWLLLLFQKLPNSALQAQYPSEGRRGVVPAQNHSQCFF